MAGPLPVGSSLQFASTPPTANATTTYMCVLAFAWWFGGARISRASPGAPRSLLAPARIVRELDADRRAVDDAGMQNDLYGLRGLFPDLGRLTCCPARRAAVVALCAVWFAASATGCEEKRKPQAFKSAKSRKAKRKTEVKKEKLEKVDPIDEAWNTPPTEGMAKLRLALHGDDGMIKGRPVFMAPQFELVAVEQLEKIHEDGFRTTDRKKGGKFNPNEHGRYVHEVKPGHWKIYVNPLDDLWEAWISDVFLLKAGESRSIDVPLVRPKKHRKKY